MPSRKKLRTQLEGLFTAQVAAPEAADTAQPQPAAGGLPATTGWAWETDARGAFTFCSGDVEAVLGYLPAEMLGKTLASLIPITNGDEAAIAALANPASDIKQAYASAQPLIDVWIPARRKDKQVVMLILNGRPMLDEKGKLLGYKGLSDLARPVVSEPLPAPAQPTQPAPPQTPAPKSDAPTSQAPMGEATPTPAEKPPTKPIRKPVTSPLLASIPAAPSADAKPGSGELLPKAPRPVTAQPIGFVASPAGLKPIEDSTPIEPPDALALPIQLQDQTLGALQFFDDGGPRVWSEDDLALAQAVADQLALALENVRLFNETREYLVKQTLLYDVTRAAATATNVSEALQGAAEALARVLPQSNVAIFLMDATDQHLHVRAAVGLPAEISERLVIPVGAGITGWVAQNNQPQLVADVSQDKRYVPTVPGIRAEAAVPLALGDRVIGALNVESAQPNAFDASDVQLLSTLAGTLSAIIVNNNLLEQIEQERQRLSLLYDALHALAGSLEYTTTINTALGLAARLGGQHAYMLLLGETSEMDSFNSTVPGLADLPPAERLNFAHQMAWQGLERWILEERRATVVNDTNADSRWYSGPTPSTVQIRSVIATPLQTQRSALRGVLAYTHTEPNAFSDDQLPLMESIAGQVTVALENALLLQQVKRQQGNSTRLAEATQAVSSILDEDVLLQTLARQLFDAYLPNAVYIWGWDVENEQLTPRVVQLSADDPPPPPHPVEGQVIFADEREDLLEVIDTRQLRLHPAGPDNPLCESLAVPMVYGGEVEGVVEIIHTGITHGLNRADQELAQAILIASASALQTARLYEEQRQTAERLAEVDRLKSQFLANMSHELRTPLNSIIGFSRVILKGIDGPLTDLQTQDLTSINNAGQHLLGLINSVLDMAKIEAGKMELVLDEVDLTEVVKNAVATSIPLVKDKLLTLVEDLEPNLPPVRADSLRFRQVLFNLISNAAKFSDHGVITVRARTVDHSGPPPPPARGGQKTGLARVATGRFVEISVADEGHGIAEADLSKLFEAFSQVDASATRKTGGTGLGLSICRQLVELHGGRIWVRSWPGEGSTFSFTLPVYVQPSPVTPPTRRVTGMLTPPPAVRPAPAPTAPVVMAVDDDPGVISLYRRYLEPHGYKVVGVNQSSEAAARAAEVHPDIILLDVLMPNKDGWQVLTELKQMEATRDVPVVLCTLVGDVARGQSLGASDYLTKPILESDLMRALNRLKTPIGR
jgi:signal transduction histidine kinase